MMISYQELVRTFPGGRTLCASGARKNPYQFSHSQSDNRE
jgi:hypothetical protein